MQVMVDGLLTTYLRDGKGRTVVLLHGWGDRASGLKVVQSALSAHFDVIAPDLPGFGGTQAPMNAWKLGDYAAFVAHFLQKLDVSSVYALIGHSNGGAIAIRELAGGALQPDRLVLLASAGIRGEYMSRNKILRVVAKASKVASMPLPKRAKSFLRQSMYRTIGSDMLVAEHMQETFKQIVAEDIREDAHNITVPTLLIYGEADTATPLRYGELLHELISGSTLEVLPGAGHFLFNDRPDETMRAIMEFLR